jgi:hypothetical protein
VCFFAVAATSANADCDRPRSAITALKQSDVVFRGTVRQIDIVSRNWNGWANRWIVTLDVSRVWKGRVGQRFTLHIAQTQEDDAFEPFEHGVEYLVFALRNSPQESALFHVSESYGATGCGGTTSLLWGMSYLVELGPGARPGTTDMSRRVKRQ